MVNVVLFGVKSKEEEYKKIEKEQDTKQEAEWIGRRCCVGTVIGRGESKQFFPTKSRILFSLISTVVHSSTVCFSLHITTYITTVMKITYVTEDVYEPAGSTNSVNYLNESNQ